MLLTGRKGPDRCDGLAVSSWEPLLPLSQQLNLLLRVQEEEMSLLCMQARSGPQVVFQHTKKLLRVSLAGPGSGLRAAESLARFWLSCPLDSRNTSQCCFYCHSGARLLCGVVVEAAACPSATQLQASCPLRQLLPASRQTRRCVCGVAWVVLGRQHAACFWGSSPLKQQEPVSGAGLPGPAWVWKLMLTAPAGVWRACMSCLGLAAHTVAWLLFALLLLLCWPRGAQTANATHALPVFLRDQAAAQGVLS